MKRKGGILQCIGNTPLVDLNNVISDSSIQLSAKFEFLNPSGSVKDRLALYMLEKGISEKVVSENSHIVESSSGNLAIALAMICRYLKLPFTCVVDPNITDTNLNIIKSYGANIQRVTETDEFGGYLVKRIDKVKEFVAEHAHAVWLNQYANPHNWQSHYYGEAEEILQQSSKPVDFLVLSVSTGGTLQGLAKRLKLVWPNMKVIAVDALGSVLFRQASETLCVKRELPGMGASRVPEIFDNSLIDEVVHVDDYEAAVGCRHLLHEEGIMVGGSSGAVISAILKLKSEQRISGNVLTLFPDRGDRYLDLIYDDVWLEKARYRHQAYRKASMAKTELV